MSLRIVSARGDVRREGVERGVGRISSEAAIDTYLGRLVKLLPGEALSLYPVLAYAARQVEGENQTVALTIAAWAVLLVVIAIRWMATSIPGHGPQWGAIAIAAIAFGIWVPIIDNGGGLGLFQLANSIVPIAADLREFINVVLLVVWSTLVPFLYRGDPA